MKKIKWTLPFKNMNYLLSLTEEIAKNPFIVLVTGIEDRNGNIDSCTITIKKTDNIDEVIMSVGATIGAHSVEYAMEMMEMQNNFLSQVEQSGFCFCEEEQKDEAPGRYPIPNEDVVVEDKQDLFEDEVINIEEIPDSEARTLLRNILNNFKK